ncbi:DUF4260 domain-containing protein [Acinetobacter rudis]|uniref:DUF4260 domain-containing protein n=1 Tax=Acinetobacter rudis TaxID=632955 RepID=UPI0035BE12D4
MNFSHLIILRLENLCIAIIGLSLYYHFAFDWMFFLYCILLPDLSILAYAFNNRIGALSYNLGHNYIFPSLLILLCIFLSQPILLSIGLIWIIHIGLDRALGFGLKHAHNFKSTHLNLNN